MKALRNVGLALVILFVLTALPAVAEGEAVTTNIKYPIDWWAWVPCANGGAGEFIVLSGYMHELWHTTLDGKGGFHAKMHFNPQGLSGEGLTTSDKYNGTGVTQDHFNAKVGEQYTFVNNYRMIGQGPGNNFLIHENWHYTVNANGDVTAEVDNYSVVCK